MRLIDADKLINVVKKDINFNKEYCLDNFFTKGYRAGMRNLYNIIANQPTIDSIKHGYWKESKCLDDCFWVCSCCKCPSQAIAAPKLYKYCPNCGARMDAQFGDSGL